MSETHISYEEVVHGVKRIIPRWADGIYIGYGETGYYYVPVKRFRLRRNEYYSREAWDRGGMDSDSIGVVEKYVLVGKIVLRNGEVYEVIDVVEKPGYTVYVVEEVTE